MTHTELRVSNWVMPIFEQQVNPQYLGQCVRGIGVDGEIHLYIEHQNSPSVHVAEKVSMSADKYLVVTLLPSGVAGIPLDKDWLERFGFRVREHSARIGSRKGGNGLLLTVPYDGALEGWRWLMDDGGDIPAIFDIRVKFVHQLQNLFFALTGQELTYDATKHEPGTDSTRP